MARYKKGTGKRPNQSIKKSTPAQTPPIKQEKEPELIKPPEPKDELDQIRFEIEQEAALNSKEQAKENEKIEKTLNPEIKDDFDPKQIEKIAKGYEPAIGLTLDATGAGLEFWTNDKRGNWPEMMKEVMTENLAVIAAILWPDMGSMSPREKMLFFSGTAVVQCIVAHGTTIYGLKSGSIPKLEEKNEINQNDSATNSTNN